MKRKTLNAQPAYAEGFGVADAHLSRRSESEGGTSNAQRPTEGGSAAPSDASAARTDAKRGRDALRRVPLIDFKYA
jgi:hypothetical protein